MSEIFGEKKHISPDKAPLLEFLEYCKSVIEKQASQDLLEEIKVWKKEVANRLNIDLKKFCACVQKKVKQPAQMDSPSVLLKIAPNIGPENQMSKNTFILQPWVFHDKNNPQKVDLDIIKEYYTREKLETILPEILGETIARLGEAANKAIFEIIIPFQLFDYNINQIQIQVGPAFKKPLGKCFPVVARSWDRIYWSNYNFVRQI